MNTDYSQPNFDQLQAKITILQTLIEQQQAQIADLQAERAPTLEAVSPHTTSRRRLLKRLAVASAGTVTGAALFAANGSNAEAAGGSNSNIGWYAFPGPNANPPILGSAIHD